jgi:hypothetical protein
MAARVIASCRNAYPTGTNEFVAGTARLRAEG